MRDLALILAVLLAAASAVHAHGGGSHGEASWWTLWNGAPLLLISMGSVTAGYGLGLARIWGRMGLGRGISRWQAGSFAAGVGALVLSLLSPVNALSADLSSVHMIQHMLLMMVAAPLMVLGHPSLAFLWALPASWRPVFGRASRRMGAWRGRWYPFWQPTVAWVVFALALWIWHLPVLYQAALRDQGIHDLQHLAFFGTAALYWRVLLDPVGRIRLNRGAGVLYLFTTSLHATVLGVFMALSPRAWYSDYEARTSSWGLTPLEDQQLAGLIMWMPACAIYAVAAIGIFALWLREEPT
jgi:cytochrome c oxidase assembly factor CtaG